LESELAVIQKTDHANYFLIVGDIARFAEEQGIFYTARGSASGSLVCYVLGISSVCPLEFGLLFERFLVENHMPDVDFDFDEERRQEIIDYVSEKYGKDNVVRLGTIGTMAVRQAVKDVGRALDLPIPFVNDVLKLIPYAPYTTIENALEESAELNRRYKKESKVMQLLDLARPLEGLARNTSVHPCGFAIADVPLVDYIPLQKVATQWQDSNIEEAGVLRLDFLGLRNLTKIAKTIETIKKTKGETIDPHKIPLDDRETFDMISQGETKGVFQMESDGMRELLQRLQPDNFRDIVTVLAMYRPGLLGMVDQYVAVKHGSQTVEYLHPVMEEVLGETHGVMVYQEQVMQILNRLGNIPLVEAFSCIKAIAKKKDISKFRERFLEGFQANAQARETGEAIFEQIVKFAGYGFNKSHAVVYARIAYITAYLKAHYPVEFAACSEH
jgi:DNA polymerase-3 subunit alpha